MEPQKIFNDKEKEIKERWCSVRGGRNRGCSRDAKGCGEAKGVNAKSCNIGRHAASLQFAFIKKSSDKIK